MSLSPGKVQARIDKCRTLPSLPRVAVELLELWEDESVSIARIARTVSTDPALSARLVRQANSPFYGFRSRVDSIERAVTLMGLNATMSLCLGFSLLRDRRRKGDEDFDHDRYWHRSAAAAVAARVLGRKLSVANPDGLFLAGLLQDLGMLVLVQALPEIYSPLLRRARGDHVALARFEHDALGADHAGFGRYLLAKWGFPEDIAAAVGSSHNPMLKDNCFARCVALGGVVAEIFAGPGEATSRSSAQLTRLLQGDGINAEEILEATAAELREVATSYDIDCGSPEDAEETLARAREALIELSLDADQRERTIRGEITQLVAEKETLETKASKDALTGLLNRALLDERVMRQFAQATRFDVPLSVLFLDIDHFKKINDAFGHQSGDAVLKALAGLLNEGTRATDIVGRYGGEEFVVILPGTPADGAGLVAERLRAKIAEASIPVKDQMIGITISIGIATQVGSAPYADAGDLLEAADQALYAAKNGGRNRAVAA